MWRTADQVLDVTRLATLPRNLEYDYFRLAAIFDIKTNEIVRLKVSRL